MTNEKTSEEHVETISPVKLSKLPDSENSGKSSLSSMLKNGIRSQAQMISHTFFNAA